MLASFLGEVVVVWLVVVVWVVDVVVLAFFGELAVVVACVVAVGVVWVAAAWDLDVLWVNDGAWVARGLRGLALLVVVAVVALVVVGMDATWCFVELVDELLPPHAARLSVSATALRAAIKPRTLNSARRRKNDGLSIRLDM